MRVGGVSSDADCMQGHTPGEQHRVKPVLAVDTAGVWLFRGMCRRTANLLLWGQVQPVTISWPAEVSRY